ncbi:hypothetical protein [Bradyrhizobium sp. ORS 111]|uniref:hypothetical protein n=1 Tax=Bradyrhizobium sp. ORS 111 TaxID=1685958 RepID=UPI00388E2E70
MIKALIAGAVAIGLVGAPAAAGAMTTQHKTQKTHHTKKMTPGTTTGMSSGTSSQRSGGTANQKMNSGEKNKQQGY